MPNRIISQISKLALLMLIIPAYCISSSLQLTGKIIAIGHEPFVKMALYTSQTQSYVVSGHLETELKNLQGATVKVKGRVNGTDPRNQLPILEVNEYKVIAIGEGANTRTPWVGILAGQNNLYLQTEDGQQIRLEGALVTTLLPYKGAKLWLAGSIRSTGFWLWKKTWLTPTAFNVIRPKQP